MGLLKLGSIYKKSKSKKDKPETPPLPTPPPTLEPLSLNLDINFSQSNADTTATKQTIHNDSFLNTPATSPQPQTGIPGGSLFDDIFSELNPRSNGPTPKDELQSDISLALALSHHLQIDEPKTTVSYSGTTQNGNKSSNNNTNSDRKEVSDFLLGEDSIYSSYLKNLSSFDNSSTINNDSAISSSDFSTSMFASLMGPTPQQSRSQPQSSSNGYSANNNGASSTSTSSQPPPPLPSAVSSVTKPVLDSDISDSDDSKMSDESDDEVRQAAKQQNKRMTKGMQPIMERRPQDHHLLVQRKIDNWSSRVDPEANKVESREAIISRMKDRHRNEVKMAALRQQQQQQQQQHQQVNMMNMHRVPQVYGAPIIPHSPIVSPHPGMMLDPSQMYHNPLHVQNDYASPPLPPQRDINISPPLPQSSFIPSHNKHQHAHPDYDHHSYPIMQHSTSTPQGGAHSKSSGSSSRVASARASKPVSSKSSPTSNNSSTTNLSVTSSASSMASNVSNRTQKKKKAEEEQKQTKKKSKSRQEESEVRQIGEIEEGEVEVVEEQEYDSEHDHDHDGEKLHTRRIVPVEIDDENKISSVETLNNHQPVHLEDPTEADVESSGEDDVAIAMRRKKSLRKLRQKEEGEKQVRSSRSAPNLKKKQGKKSKSRSSSRRNSQEFNTTPNSEYASHEEHHPMQAFPRSQSHTNVSHSPHHPIRHLKSESDLRHQQMRAGPSSSQHQLNYEWERMQAFQREQQLKNNSSNNKNKYGSHFTNSPQAYPVYAPVYYPAMGNSSSVPYPNVNGGIIDNSFYQQQYSNDPRASAMPGYGYPATNQAYYTR